MSPILGLNQNRLSEGVAALVAIDKDLEDVVAKFGSPPMWAREEGFPTLLHIILEQQVSLASAKAAFTKLTKAADPLTPESFLSFSDTELKGFGFSRQKTRYGRALSEAILSGDLDLDSLNKLDDESVRKELIKIKGIGTWTANIYLLMALLRPDIWPTGDLALAKAIQNIKKLPELPGQDEQLKIAEKWKPWRAVGARILWHHYLSA
ncbi:MAG: DNA-3-methyladenine glycosylase 2 family protein [Chloroflexi bacterium]|nr:DNA-3-methyladenine glycosylase 2 family protein [Chloroflexota bacterium]